MKRRASIAIPVLVSTMFIAFASRDEIVQGALPSPIQVTTTGSGRPTISPTGEFMAYELETGLAVMTLATGTVETITVEDAFEPDWSRDNGRVLYRGGDPYGLWTFPFLPEEGFHPVFFTDEGFDDGAAWGPGGHHVVAQTSSGPYGDGLVILAYPSGIQTYLNCLEPDQTSCSGEDPTPSPDGLWIAFNDGALEKVDRNLGGTSVYVTTAEQGGGDPSWSPDGNWIAFVKYEGATEVSHIWVTDSRGSEFGLVQLTSGDYNDFSPAWSPNSDEIYFASNRSGTDEVWKVAFDPGTVPTRKLTWGKLKARNW